jgi:hypothetical protein
VRRDVVVGPARRASSARVAPPVDAAVAVAVARGRDRRDRAVVAVSRHDDARAMGGVTTSTTRERAESSEVVMTEEDEKRFRRRRMI